MWCWGGSARWSKREDRPAPAGGFFVAANSSTSGGGQVLRLSDDGDVVWARKLEGLTIELIDASATADGGLLVCGVVLDEGDFHWAVAKLDSEGELLQAKRYGCLQDRPVHAARSGASAIDRLARAVTSRREKQSRRSGQIRRPVSETSRSSRTAIASPGSTRRR